MKKKQLLATLLASAMVMSTLLTGCGAEEAGKSSEVEPSSSSSEETPVEPSSSEGPAEPTKIKIGLQSHQQVTDYENNNLTKIIEEKFNCDIEFVMLPVDGTECGTKISLMLADGKDLPDMWMTLGGLNIDACSAYGLDGYFANLRDYVSDPEVMPNLSYILENEDLINQTFYSSYVASDGGIYGVGYIYEPSTTAYYVPHINKTWLDQLGLAIPTNLDELKACLIAFRDNDCNGNGVKDEIPFYGTLQSGIGRFTVDQIINSFTYWGGNRDTNKNIGVKDGQIYAMFTTDEYRQALTYLNGLYEENLIPDQIFTDTKDEYKAILKIEPTVTGFCTMAWYGDGTEDMQWIPLLEGPEGIAYTFVEPTLFSAGTAITEGTENMDLCLEILDWCYSKEGLIYGVYGEEGSSWTKNPDVMIAAGIDEKYRDQLEKVEIASIRDLNQFNHNETWRGYTPYYSGWFNGIAKWSDDGKLVDGYIAAIGIGDAAAVQVANDSLSGQKQVYEEYSKENYSNWWKKQAEAETATPAERLPALKYTDEEKEAVAEIITNVDQQVWLTLTDFIKGDRDIESDADWDTYLKEMEQLGLNDWIAAAQAAYDRVK